jgi:hypothetical protein
MEKKLPPGSSKSSKSEGQCCGKSNHFPSPEGFPMPANSVPVSNELFKNLSAEHVSVSLFELREAPTHSPPITISPQSIPIQSFPLRV